MAFYDYFLSLSVLSDSSMFCSFLLVNNINSVNIHFTVSHASCLLLFLFFSFGPHLAALRDYLCLCTQKFYSWQAWGTKWDARDQTWIGHIQDQHPSCCAITPTPRNIYFYRKVPKKSRRDKDTN